MEISAWLSANTLYFVTKIFDQSRNSRHLEPCTSNSLPTFVRHSFESSVPFILFQNSGFIYTLDIPFEENRACVGTFDLIPNTGGIFSLESATVHQSVFKRAILQHKLQVVQTLTNTTNIDPQYTWGESVGISSFGYSFAY